MPNLIFSPRSNITPQQMTDTCLYVRHAAISPFHTHPPADEWEKRVVRRHHVLAPGGALESCTVFDCFEGGAYLTARNRGRSYVGIMVEREQVGGSLILLFMSALLRRCDVAVAVPPIGFRFLAYHHNAKCTACQCCACADRC
jgi:hypothetical protein